MFNSLYYLPNQIADLNGNQIIKNISLSNLKKQTEILVIDDETFPLIDDLRRNEFSITYKVDISTIKDVEAYSIILCDIRGVGKFLKSSSEGAYLVDRIKSKYPTKIVISYSADTTSVDAQKYLSSADNVVPKGTSIEDWVSILENSIKELVNPVSVWRKIAIKLFKAGTPTRDIARIESRYVNAIKKGKYQSLSQLFEDNAELSSILSFMIQVLVKVFGAS